MAQQQHCRAAVAAFLPAMPALGHGRHPTRAAFEHQGAAFGQQTGRQDRLGQGLGQTGVIGRIGLNPGS